MPAHAGIQTNVSLLGSRLRGNDDRAILFEL